jgi:hypothetical protein
VKAARRERVAPCELGAIEATARRIFPLGLCRQLLACPGGVGCGILEGDVHHRMLVQALVRMATAAWPPPIRTELELPPLRPIVEVDRLPGVKTSEPGFNMCGNAPG